MNPPEGDSSVLELTEPSDAPSSANPPKTEPTDLSANALKKLAKAKEKEERKAAKRQEQEQQQKQQQDAAVDFAKDNYGALPESHQLQAKDIIAMDEISPGATVTFHARVQNIRSQTAKLCFLLLRDGFHTIQAVVAAGPESDNVSRQMVKWTASVNPESCACCGSSSSPSFSSGSKADSSCIGN